MNIHSILIEKVIVGERLRKVRPDAVAALADSIREIGLQTPITVIPGVQTDGGVSEKIYYLLAGHHRLDACKRLEMSEILAFVVKMSELDQQIFEIDENLCRAELIHLERAEHLKKRKELYEMKHPETQHGVAGGKASGSARRGEVGTNENISFVQNTSEKTGKTERSIQQSVRRANNISPGVRDQIRGIDAIADNASELDALAALKEPEQTAAVQAVMNGEARSIREAVRKHGSEHATKSKKNREQVPKDKPAQESSDTPSSDEAQEWKRKAKLASTEVLAAKERIRTLNKERSTLKTRIKELESQPPEHAVSPSRIEGFHSVLDDIATAVRSDPTTITPQELDAIRNHLLRTTAVIEEVLTAINQPFSQWGE